MTRSAFSIGKITVTLPHNSHLGMLVYCNNTTLNSAALHQRRSSKLSAGPCPKYSHSLCFSCVTLVTSLKKYSNNILYCVYLCVYLCLHCSCEFVYECKWLHSCDVTSGFVKHHSLETTDGCHDNNHCSSSPH